MKNKSKLKKIKERNNNKSVWPKEWSYISNKPVTIRDIYNVLIENDEYQAELWEGAGILEVAFEYDKSIDMECADETDFTEKRFIDLLNGQDVKSAFYVTVGSEKIDVAEKVMKKITGNLSGVFFADDATFNLVIK